MKKVLMILGGIFGLILVALLAVGAYGAAIGPALDRESKAWVDEIVPKVTATWDADILIANSSPELLEIATRDEFEGLMAKTSSELGGFKAYLGSKGEGIISIHNGVKTLGAEYVASVEFEKGVAQISIRGIKRNGEWKVLNFQVNVPVISD